MGKKSNKKLKWLQFDANGNLDVMVKRPPVKTLYESEQSSGQGIFVDEASAEVWRKGGYYVRTAVDPNDGIEKSFVMAMEFPRRGKDRYQENYGWYFVDFEAKP